MTTLSFVKSAIKGKAPIAAIPVEGHAPVCVDRKRLAAWSKGVTITRVEVETHYTFDAPKADYSSRYYDSVTGAPCREPRTPEGPHHRSEGSRTLIIEGSPASAPYIRSRCRMIAIDRRTAIKTLSAWSEKERARLLKRTMLGALAKDTKRAIKLAALGDNDGARTITIQIRLKTGKVINVSGVPVTLPGFDGEFIVHRTQDSDSTSDTQWTVSERYTGRAAGWDSSAEKALLDAHENIRKATPAGLAAIYAQVAEAKLAALPQIAA